MLTRIKNVLLGGTQTEILLALLSQKAGSEEKWEKSSQILENETPLHQMAWSNSVFRTASCKEIYCYLQSVYMGGYKSEQASSFF